MFHSLLIKEHAEAGWTDVKATERYASRNAILSLAPELKSLEWVLFVELFSAGPSIACPLLSPRTPSAATRSG